MWKEVANRELEKTLVTEDSVCFENQFKRKLMKLMGDIQQAQPDWELIYIGRKRMRVQEPEKAVPSVMNLVEADYSCWTLGYAVSFQGTQKLIGAEPFSKMLPVGEFLPVMYNKHPVAELLTQVKGGDRPAAEGLLCTGPEPSRDQSRDTCLPLVMEVLVVQVVCGCKTGGCGCRESEVSTRTPPRSFLRSLGSVCLVRWLVSLSYKQWHW
ncbi:procollagen galactosyltransferase 2-like [Ara ararauna]